MNKISQVIDRLHDATALTLLALIAIELAYIGSELAELVSKL